MRPSLSIILASYGPVESLRAASGLYRLPIPTMPDTVTMVGYGLGLWWGLGGPHWAGVASVIADEVDGRLARATNTATAYGSSLDWGGDVALTPLALTRLASELGVSKSLGIIAAVPVLYGQSRLRGDGWRPTIGSARAAVTLAAIGVSCLRRKKRRFRL